METIENKPVAQNYIPSVIDETQHWILGDSCLSTEPIFSDSHGWRDFIPQGEVQSRNGFDSINCTNYSKYNCVEAIGRQKYGAEFQNNLSERHAGVESGTTPSGNSLQNVCETLRKLGAIPEAFLPFDESINSWPKYYSPRPMTFELWKTGQKWLQKYQYNHDWVFLPGDSPEVKISKMKEALKYSPLSVAGYAWSKHSDGLYYSDGTANHAFDVVDFVEGQYWIVLDSYTEGSGSFEKKLSWTYDFKEAKRHSLSKKVGGESAPEPKYIDYLKYRFAWYLKDIFQ